MRLASKLYLTFGLLLSMVIINATLTVWTARQTLFYLERTKIAHKQYESYLSLSNHTYQLFKQFGDAMLIGDQDRGMDETILLGKLRADITRIRNLIGEEILLVGQEEIKELKRLAQIEKQIEDLIENLIMEHQAIAKSKRTSTFDEYWRRLSRLLDVRIDKDFNELIQEVIDYVAEEVRETREDSAAKIALFTLLAVVFALTAILSTIVSLWVLRRDIKKPIEQLLIGARALSQGKLKQRIDTNGPLELSGVAHAFNRMATEILKRETALAQSNENLEKTVAVRTARLKLLVNKLKVNEANRKRLLADVSHELRTPLTIIRGEADIALRGQVKSSEVYREALGKCRDAAEHTARLVDDLLFVARSEAGEIRIVFKAVDLAKLLPLVVEEHYSILKEHNKFISFTSTLTEAIIHGDEGRIKQVSIILLENALRYGGEEIDVRLERAPVGYAISVSDNGTGMTQEEQSYAFDRFFRGSNAAVNYSQGAGLGLPVAKAIVEAHGGKIALSSEPAQGLTFSFTIPTRHQLRAVS